MKEFRQLCKEIEDLSPEQYTIVVADCAARVIPALAAITDSGFDGITMCGLFILSALAADGRLSKGEYDTINALFEPIFGDALDYDLLKAHFKQEKDTYKTYTDTMLRIISHVSDAVKEDIVFLCLLVCAVDGKITLKERLWIEQLIAA